MDSKMVGDAKSSPEQHKEVEQKHGITFDCDLCEKQFTRKSSLNRHKLIHTGLKPYQCDLCEKSFPLPGNLTKHRNVHSAIKPHECDICNKTFT